VLHVNDYCLPAGPSYLRSFDRYSLTYGSLVAVFILLLWFYLTGAAILVGGKVNAEIENSVAKMLEPGRAKKDKDMEK